MWPFKKKPAPAKAIVVRDSPQPEVWEFVASEAGRANRILSVCERRLANDDTLLKMCDRFLEGYDDGRPSAWSSWGGLYEPFKHSATTASIAVQAERHRIAHRVAVAKAARAVERVALAREKIGLPNCG